MSVKTSGFTLPEMLIALAIGSTLMMGAARMLPLLQMYNLRSLTMFQLKEEMQQMTTTLEKAVRRAGYCRGECQGDALKTDGISGTCLLVRWDENSNGKWDAVERDDSDFYGYRLRGGNLEVQRGVDRCDGTGWEKLNDPAVMVISDFRIVRQGRQVRLTLGGYAKVFPQQPVVTERWITAVNL
ncbi:prepilin peptidase-dependent protein [Erwinia sp. 9145]|uniref:prepilin peptidase-dependent protein n=1 Tax=Erwinia sp. 9145 TaxID=1500895 RepID=UPI000552C6B4|nr:prepilin peptidase-dependent protein [Erwinia sp. 9145]